MLQSFSPNNQLNMQCYKLSSLSFERLLTLGNAIIFLLNSLGISFIQPDSLAFVLLPNVIFFIGSLFGWGLMMQRGWALTPISWYVLGAGLFFGFGVIVGGMHVHPWSAQVYGSDLTYLLEINVLNAASVLTVLLIANWFVNNRNLGGCTSERTLQNFLGKVVPLTPLFLFGLFVVALRFIFFPEAENLVVRSILAKVYFLLPAIFLLGGVMLNKMQLAEWLLFLLVFFLQLANGILLHNKYEILMPILALIIGMWSSLKSYKLLLATLIVPTITFWLVNPIISMSRLHYKYDSTGNSVIERIEIVQDVINSSYLEPAQPLNPVGKIRDTVNVSQRMALPERLRAVAVRFDVASIEGFLIKEFHEGRPGNSLKDFWVVFVPRVFWPEKPIITRFGNELNVKYHNNDIAHSMSAMAPTYSGEAYWNYGWAGVFLISIYLGIIFGIFTRIGLNAAKGVDIAYLFIAYPLLVSAAFVESWIAATYIGGVAIIVLYYVAIKILLSLIARGGKSV